MLSCLVCLVGAVGIEPTTFGLKDQNRAQPLPSATVSYRKICPEAYAELGCSGMVVCEYPHKSRTVGRKNPLARKGGCHCGGSLVSLALRTNF